MLSDVRELVGGKEADETGACMEPSEVVDDAQAGNYLSFFRAVGDSTARQSATVKGGRPSVHIRCRTAAPR